MGAKTLYNVADGRILARSLSGHGLDVGESTATVNGSYDGATHYMPAGVPTPRAVINYAVDKATIAPGGETATVTGIPDPAAVHHKMVEYPTTGGTFSVDSDDVGEFGFVIDEPAFLKTLIKITVADP